MKVMCYKVEALWLLLTNLIFSCNKKNACTINDDQIPSENQLVN